MANKTLCLSILAHSLESILEDIGTKVWMLRINKRHSWQSEKGSFESTALNFVEWLIRIVSGKIIPQR